MRKGRKIIERILGRILKEKEDARKNKTEREKEEVDEEGGG